MSDRGDGGSAFPTDANNSNTKREGMSLRDWFAGQALIAFLSNPKNSLNYEAAADAAFVQADAMLAERKAKP